jgi:hypothetical protein
MGERIEMTDELRKQLAGCLPFSNDATTMYTPEFFLQKKVDWKDSAKTEIVEGEYVIPDGYRPVFEVRCFKKDEYDNAHKIMQEERNDKEHLHTIERLPKIRESIRKVVKGWTDLWDIGKMEQIPFVADADGGADKLLFEKMPDPVLLALQDYVYKISGLKKADYLSLK